MNITINRKVDSFDMLLDDEDFVLIEGLKLNIQEATLANSSNYYAVAFNKSKPVPVHRIVTACPPRLVVHHINGNGLDNRKVNLVCLKPSDHVLAHSNPKNLEIILCRQNKAKLIDKEVVMGVYQLQQAIEMALQAHKGQTDKAGELYVLHPLRVMDKGTNIHERIVGVLHDTIEDTDITYDDISLTFGTYIANAVNALTRVHGETYEAFIDRVKLNPLARQVKLYDLADNLLSSRSGGLSESLLKRYVQAQITLGQAY